MQYQEIFPHSATRPVFQTESIPKLQGLWHILKLSINNSTWLALGATLQACLVLLPIPRFYTLAPGVIYLLSRIVLTCLVTYEALPNPYLKGATPYRCTAIVPDEQGNFPSEGNIPTKQKIAVLLLCARVNHPAGWLASPHMTKFGELFEKMNSDFHLLPQEVSGFLGHSQAFMPTPDGTLEVLNFSYWRSKEHILRYADSPAHREAVKWWTELGGYDEKGGKIPHIGIAHEIYESEPGNWESVYLRYQPTLLGATSFLKKGDKPEAGVVPDEWMSPIVEARRGKLAGSKGRMRITSQTKFGSVEM